MTSWHQSMSENATNWAISAQCCKSEVLKGGATREKARELASKFVVVAGGGDACGGIRTISPNLDMPDAPMHDQSQF